jgi:hypothetical protein
LTATLREKSEGNPAIIVGKLQAVRLNPPDYIALIEREDIDTVHQHRHLELLVNPSVVDRILAADGILETLRFTVSQGKIVDVAKA